MPTLPTALQLLRSLYSLACLPMELLLTAISMPTTYASYFITSFPSLLIFSYAPLQSTHLSSLHYNSTFWAHPKYNPFFIQFYCQYAWLPTKFIFISDIINFMGPWLMRILASKVSSFLTILLFIILGNFNFSCLLRLCAIF